MIQANQLIQLVNESETRFAKINPSDWDFKPNENKWSKKEILGHLIDSAQNNIRRVIVTQYQQNDKIFYLQDDWVRIQRYQEANVEDLILLWKALNLQFARIIESLPTEKWSYTCDTERTQQQELHTLEFLISDYLRHMNHHIDQIKI